MVPQLGGLMGNKYIDLLNREIASTTITEYLLRMGNGKMVRKNVKIGMHAFRPFLGKKSQLFYSWNSK